MATKTKAEKTVEITETAKTELTKADLEQKVIQLGCDLCDGIKNGIIRKDDANINAITNLYTALKT